MIVGIDFGTCFSQPAIMSGMAPMADNIGEREGIPSTFAFDKKNNRNIFGAETRRCNPDDVIRYMKRAVRESPDGFSKQVKSGGKDFMIGDVIEMYIGYLLDEVRRVAESQDYLQNKDFERVTITAPLGIERGSMMATDYYSFIRKTVMDKTGLSEDNVFILSEPEAAALCYLWKDGNMDKSSDKTILVFDLGGGTLDINIMRYHKNTGKFESLVDKGDLYLGGNDWDERLKKVVIEKEPKFKKLADANSLEFEEEIVSLKMKLSVKQSGTMNCITDDGDDIDAKVSREEFEVATRDLCRRAMDLLEEAIESYEYSHDEPIDNIILVGGASAMPQIKSGIERAVPEYSDKIIQDPAIINPSKSIAKGAAIHAYNTTRVIHVTKQTYGFKCLKGGKVEKIYNMIFVNTPHGGIDGNEDIVVRAPDTFNALCEDQKTVPFICYETVDEKKDCEEETWSELDEKAVPNGKMVEAKVPEEYYKNKRSKEYKIRPEFRLDIDGVLKIDLYDNSGKLIASTDATEGA